MTKEAQQDVQHELIKWGFVAIISLTGAGLLSLANRNVYSKDQVDTRLEYVTSLQQVQNDNTNKQLTIIRADIQDIKSMVR